MSSAAINWTNSLVVSEQKKTGVNKPEAINRVAERAKVTPGQIEGVIRGKVKDLKARFVERIRAAFIAEMTREIQRLSHEIQMARQCGLRPDAGEILAARDAMARLQDVLEG